MTPLHVAHVVDRACPAAARYCDLVRGGLPADGYRHTVLERPTGLDWQQAWRLAQDTALRSADVVHLWDRWSVRRVGPLVGRRAAARTVCTLHGPRRGDYLSDVWLERFTLGRAARIVSHDAAVRDDWMSGRGAGAKMIADRWSILPVGVEQIGDVRISTARAALRTAMGIEPQAPVMGVAAHLVPDANVKDVVWAAALLRVLHPDLRTVVIGAGPQLPTLRRFIRLMRVADIVTVLDVPGRTPADAVAGLDVYVDPSRWTGPAPGITAAQSAGIPVLCVDTPIRRRQIAVDRSGHVFAEHDRAALVRRLRKLLIDADDRTRMAIAARDWAAGQPKIAEVVAQYGEIYQSIAL